MLILTGFSFVISLFSKQIIFASLNSYLLFQYVLFGLIIVNIFSKNDFVEHTQILLYITALIALWGIIQFFFPGLFSPYSYLPGKWKVFSTFGNPSYLAAFLAGLIPLSINNYLQKKSKESFFIALLPILCLLLTFARASWLSIIIVLLFWITRIKKIPWFKIVVYSGLIILIITLIIQTHSGFKKHFFNFNSLKGRFFLWKISAHVMKDHWLVGLGLNQFRCTHFDYQYKMLKTQPQLAQLYAPFAPVEEYLHNDFLQIFVELGLIGLIIFIYLLYRIFKTAQPYFKKPFSFEFAAFLGLLALLINALFFFPFYLPPTLLLSMFLLSIISNQEKTFITFKLHIITKIVLSSFALLTIFLCFRVGLGDIYLEKGYQALNKNLLNIAYTNFQQAVHYNPWSGENRYFLAKTLYYQKQFPAALKELTKAELSFRNYYTQALAVFIYHKQGAFIKNKQLVDYINKALPGQKITLEYGLSLE
ncbi:MAG: O-antigen ligase family protein [Candidatus Margulisbacteria bacterium]|nr:O-antigen ligase family protein [Candidatus Margulisiibacteriota bacterium]